MYVGHESSGEERGRAPGEGQVVNRARGGSGAGGGLSHGPDCPEADELRQELATVAGTLNVATARAVRALERAMEMGAWQGAGYRSPEHWMTVQLGVSSRHAALLVLIARRAAAFPEVMGLFGEGKLSEDQMRPIMRHVPDGYDAAVAELAVHATVPQLERLMSRYSFGEDPPTSSELRRRSETRGSSEGPPAGEATDRHDESDRHGEDTAPDEHGGGPDRGKEAPDAAERRRRRREEHERREREEADRARRRAEREYGWFRNDEDGMWTLSARLSPEEGAVVEKALNLFRQDLFNENPEEATWHRALARMADVALGAHGDAKDRRGHDRYQVLLHVNGDALDQLTGTDPQPAARYFHLGPAVSQALARYVACDASVRLLIDRDGRSVSVGRKYRTVPDHTRRVVEDRDGGRCVFPGCANTLGLQVHHLVHWEDGGSTDTDNLCCLCGWHHRALHQGQIRISGNADVPGGLGLTIVDRHGRVIRPPKPEPAVDPPQGEWRHPTGEPYEPGLVHFYRDDPKAA